MQRPLPEVMASQDEMLRQRGNFNAGDDNTVVTRAFQSHLYDVYTWLNGKAYVKVLPVAVSRCPARTERGGGNSGQIPATSAGRGAMTRQVDGTLYRQKRK